MLRQWPYSMLNVINHPPKSTFLGRHAAPERPSCVPCLVIPASQAAAAFSLQVAAAPRRSLAGRRARRLVRRPVRRPGGSPVAGAGQLGLTRRGEARGVVGRREHKVEVVRSLTEGGRRKRKPAEKAHRKQLLESVLGSF